MSDDVSMESPLFGFEYAAPASGSASVTLRSLDFRGKLILRTRADDQDAEAAICRALSGDVPSRHSSLVPGGRLIAMAPGEWMLLLDEAGTTVVSDRLRDALGTLPSALVDVSGGQHLLQLSGPGARALLQMGCPVDLETTAFLPGHVASSLYERFPVTIVRAGNEEDGFFVLVSRSLAWSFTRCLIDQGMFLGVTYVAGAGARGLPK